MNYMNRMNLKTIQFRLFTPKKLNKTGKPILFSMKLGKLLVLVIFAMTVLVSVPHVSVLGIGSESVYAADPTNSPVYLSSSMYVGAICTGASTDKYRCAYDNGKFTIVKCDYRWNKINPEISYSGTDSYVRCLDTCRKPSTVGGTWSPSDCIEPYSKMTKTPSGDITPPFRTVITSTLVYPGNRPREHKIRIQTGKLGEPPSLEYKNCGQENTCEQQDYYSGLPVGTVVEYQSDIYLFDYTHILNPVSGFYSFTISSSGSTPPGGSSGGMTANPSSLSIVDGQTATSTISGGAGNIIAQSSDTNRATVTVSGSTITVRGISIGSATITIKDTSTPQKTVTIPVTVTQTSTTPPSGTPPAPSGSSCSYSGFTGTCSTITGVQTGVWFKSGLCSGPANNQCKLPDQFVTGCNSCHAEDGIWCQKDPQNAYCADFSDSCITDYPANPSCTNDAVGPTPPVTSPSTGTGGNDVHVDIQSTNLADPSKPLAGQPFTVTFTPRQTSVLNWQIVGGGQLRQGTVQPSSSSCVGDRCAVSVSGLPQGTYTISASIAASAGTSTLNLDPNTITVVPAAGTGTGITNQCCVFSSTSPYTYSADLQYFSTSTACTGAGGFSRPLSCALAPNNECSQFCQTRGSNGGSCRTPDSNPTVQARQFQNVCGLSGVCTCNTGGTTEVYNIACSEACLTDSRSTALITSGFSATQTAFPVGQCADPSTYQSFLLAWQISGQSGTSGASYVQQPHILRGPNTDGRGLYQCNSDQYCVCTYVNFNSFSTAAAPASLPGTRVWDDPNDITDRAPRAAPNDRVCDMPSSATITASISAGATGGNAALAQSLKLVQAGDSVTITGSVAKLSNVCKGYNYTCQTQSVIPCEMKKYYILTTLNYADCPASLPEVVHEEGKDTNVNWKFMEGFGLIAAGALTGCGGYCIGSGISLAVDSMQQAAECQNGRTTQSNALAYYTMISRFTNPSASSLAANPSSVSLNPGGTQAVAISGGTGTHTVGSSSPSVATVQLSGGTTVTVKGVAAGSAVVTVSDSSSPKKSVQISVTVTQSGSTGSGTSPSPPGSGSQLDPICVDCIDQKGGQWCLGSSDNYCDFTNECDRTSVQNSNDCPSGITGLATANPTFDITGRIAPPNEPPPQNTGSNVISGTVVDSPSSSTPSAGGSTLSGTVVDSSDTSSDSSDTSSDSPSSTGGSTISPSTGSAIGTAATVAGSQVSSGCPSAEEIMGCFRVCGKTYNAPVSAAPTCIGPVIGAAESSYQCAQGACGGFGDKKVKIEIRDPTGNTVVEDTTTTDADGKFSYTFSAPSGDGQFTAIVSVPKE